MHNRYTHIVNRYGSLEDFITGSDSANRMSPVNGNNAMIIAAVAASIIGISMAAFFIFKKRKHQ